MEQVNMTIGRFQPFTVGHLRMCEDGFKKNGLPVVILMISNKKFDSKHPFTDSLIEKELEIVKKNYKFIQDVLWVTNADIVKAGQLLGEHDYQAQLWLCGDDREEAYRKQAHNPKYREQGGYPEDFTTYTGSGRTEGVSGTAVRKSIQNDDRKAFDNLMPKGTGKLFDEFKEEISKVSESNSQSLVDFLEEII
jgi:cytidyltransferase-like protein